MHESTWSNRTNLGEKERRAGAEKGITKGVGKLMSFSTVGSKIV